MSEPTIPDELWMLWLPESKTWLLSTDETVGFDGPHLVCFSEAEAINTAVQQAEAYEIDPPPVPVRVK